MYPKNIQVQISTKTIVTFLAIVAVMFLAIELKQIIVSFFVAGILALGMEPGVEFLVKKKVPRVAAVLIVFVSFFAVVFGIIAFALGPMINQTITLFSKLPAILDNLIKAPAVQKIIGEFVNNFVGYLTRATGDVIKATVGAFSGLLTVISIVAFTAYLLIEFGSIRKLILKFIPSKNREEFNVTLRTIEIKLGAWIRGEIALMFVIGIFTFIGLTVIGVDYALSLALIAGLLEIIPVFGPTISLIPAAIVGFGNSPMQGVLVIALYIIIQQLENNLVVPKVMQKAVGFNPLITMVAVLIGGKLFGMLGIIFAVPVTLIGVTLIEHFNKKV